MLREKSSAGELFSHQQDMLQFELPLWSVHVTYQLMHWLRTCYSLMVPMDACIVRILVILWKESLYIDFGRTNLSTLRTHKSLISNAKDAVTHCVTVSWLIDTRTLVMVFICDLVDKNYS